MRTIKFRGKRVGAGEWVYGDLLHDKDIRPHIVPQRQGFNIDDDNCEIYEVDPETVGQFTGLLDKSGKKIYEGDIVKLNTCNPNFYKYITEVKYVKPAFEFYDKKSKNLFSYIENWDYEVIGNIHENKELLK